MPNTLRDLVAFTRSVDLIADVYEITSSFPRDERYGLVSQMRRCAVGVAAQIAEGEGRLTFGERRQFLSQARGSLFELEAEGIVAVRLRFMSDKVEARLRKAIARTGSALFGYVKWVQKQERAAKTKPAAKPRRNPAETG
jgi:four helix bundle protein